MNVVRAARALLIGGVLVLAGFSPVRGAAATLDARTTNPGNVFSLTALYAPASLTANASGHDVALTWPAGTNGSGYDVLGVSNPTNNCAGAVYAAVGSTTLASYTDVNEYLPQGTWFCYRVDTTYGSWSSVQGNPTAAVQIGFVANGVQLVNAGNTAGCAAGTFGQAAKLDCGDQVIVTFNQPVNTATGPSGSNTVCALTGVLYLGTPTTSGACAYGESLNLGAVVGGTVTNTTARFQATYGWTNGNKTLTVTVRARVFGSTAPGVSAATWSLFPTTVASKLQSATGGFHICDTNSGGGVCLPATPVGSTV